MNKTFIGSPNFTVGRQGQVVRGVIIHWMAGNLAGADATFQNTTRQTSAHYGVEGDTVHQYVDEANTAWHAGNWNVNIQTIGIEHSAEPGRYASDLTYESSAQLIAEAAKRHNFAINRSTIRRHSEIVATQCPGTIDIDRLIARANEIASDTKIVVSSAPVVLPSRTGTATVTASNGANVRIGPHVYSPLGGSLTLAQGKTFDYVDVVQGDNVSGISTWLKSSKGNYVWAGSLDYATTTSHAKRSGTVRVDVATLNVRYAATTTSALYGVLVRGDVHYNDTVIGQNVTVNGKTSNVWLLTDGGHWFAAAGTNY